MAKYEVTQLSFMDNRLVQPGEHIDFDGEPGPNLKPIDKAAKKAVEDAVLPTAVATLVGTLRMHATSRGVSPDEVTEVDFDEVLKTFDPKPAADVIAAAAAQVNVTLSQSLA